MVRKRIIPAFLILLLLLPAASSGEPISKKPVLRARVPEDAMLYIRIPNIWGFCCAPKEGMLRLIQSHQKHLDFIRDVKQNIEGQLSKVDSKADPLFAILMSKIQSPVEVVLLTMEGSKIPLPYIYLYTMLDIDTAEQFSEWLKKISENYPDIKLSSDITPQGEAALMIKGFPAFLRYSVSTRELNLLAGIGATKKLMDHTLKRLKPIQNHPMHQLENQIDTSGQGLLIWLNIKSILPLLQLSMQPKDFAQIKRWGLTDMHSIALGWGTSQGKGALKLIAHGPKTGYRRMMPEFSNAHDLTAAGTPRTVMTLNLPFYELFNFIKTVTKTEANIKDLKKLQEFEETFIEKLGIPIEVAFQALGPEIIIFDDEAGKFLAIHINDRGKKDQLLKSLIEKLKLHHEKYTKDGRTYHHLVIPENILFDEVKFEQISSGPWNKIKGHFYWTEDEGYMIFSGVPQALFDRYKQAKTTTIHKWLLNQQKQDIQNAVFSISTAITDSPRRIYYLYLQMLTILSDLAGVKLNLFELPSASEIDLPPAGTYGIKLDVSEEQIALTIAFENNPLEFLLNQSALPVIGVLAAVAVPNFIAYKNKAQCSLVKTEVKNVETAITVYFADPAHKTLPTLAELTAKTGYKPNPKVTIKLTGTAEQIRITANDNASRCPQGKVYIHSIPDAPDDGWRSD